jgi:hypothetical protein
MRKKIFNYAQEKFRLDEQGDKSIDATDETVVESVGVSASVVPEVKSSFVSKVAYRTFYTISYGVVFSSLLAAKLLIPKQSVIESALHDGAVAAKAALEEKARLVKEVAKQTEEILSEDLVTPEPA